MARVGRPKGSGEDTINVSVRLPRELVARLEVLVSPLSFDMRVEQPPGGATRTFAIREALVAGVDVLEERYRKRRDPPGL